MTTSRFSRRALIARGAALGAAAAFPLLRLLPAPAQAATPDARAARLQEAIRRVRARNDRVLTGRLSANGWEMERVADGRGTVHGRPVTGTPLAGVQVRLGDVETVLFHVVRRFHYEVDELRAGDVLGWVSPRAVRPARPESNQASGTAVQIRPGHYPAGQRGGFFPAQEEVIRDILAELDGVVRWGADDRHVDESRFSLDVRPGDPRLASVAARLRGEDERAGQGAGSPVDVASPARRRAAAAMRQRQRA